MKRSLYFKTKDDVLEYYGALENIPSTDLVIVEDTGSMYAVSNNASIDGEMTPTGGINWDEVAEYGYIIPVGTYNITENNNYDISSYAYAYVSVSGGQTIDPFYGNSLSIWNAIEGDVFPLTSDLFIGSIQSDFMVESENDEVVLAGWKQFVNVDETDYTIQVIVNSDSDLNGNSTGALNDAGTFYEQLDEYPDLYNDRIWPTLIDVTMTKSLDPSTDEYDYLIEGKLYNWNLQGIDQGVEEITENGFYPLEGQLGFEVNVEGGGSTYTITSAYMTDMMNQKIDDFESVDNVLSYTFTLDANHSSDTLGCVATINDTYTAYFTPSLYITDPGDNGEFSQSGYINLTEWQSTGSVQIDSTLIMDQPNIEVAVNMIIDTTPSLYGYPVEYEYVVSGYTAVEKIKVQYWDMNTSMWNDSIELVDDGNGAFEGDFWPASGYPIRFVSSVSGEMFADLQQDTTISSDLASPIDLAFSSEYTLYFDINGSCHIVIGKDSNGYKLNELTKNEGVEITNGNQVFNLYENNSFIINLSAGTLEFADSDNNTLNIAMIIDPSQAALATSTIDLDVPGVYTVQVSDTQGSDASLTLQNWTNKNITVGNLVLPAADDSDKIWGIDITVGGGA